MPESTKMPDMVSPQIKNADSCTIATQTSYEIMKTLLLLSLLAVSAAEAADVPSEPQNQPAPELQVKTAEPAPVEEATAKPAAETSSEKVVNVDAKTLLDNPQLLSRAMYSAVVSRNIAGIKVVLPIYEQWPGHDKNMALYAHGLVAQDEGKMKEAIGYYRQFIAENPDAPVVRWQLATALFEDKQNEAAADQFDKLKTEANLPEPLVKGIESYRKALRERDSWKFNAGLSVTREQNINQAPSRRTYGNWTFPDPIDATAINYQLGAEKKWSLPKGWYVTAGADNYGKIYPEQTKYNDVTTRFSVGAGYADQRNDIGLTPFHERRFYGNDPYTYSSGARLHINRWWQPKLQTLSAVEMGRLKNTRRAKSDNNNRLLSNSVVYYRNARQYWVGGFDIYQERNKEDKSDSFDRYSLRTAWGQEWGKGLSTMLRLSAAQRRYQTPSLLSGQENRRDKEADISLAVWHRAFHFKGITPRLTVAHHKTWSNDKYNEYGKTRMFVEFSKTF